MNEHIISYLNYFVELQNPQYTVLLIGKWGCGKTYFIQKQQEIWTNSSEEGKKINIKPIYVSLNGLKSVQSINDKIRSEINPFLYSRGVKVASRVLKGVIKATAKIDLDFDKDDEAEGSVTLDIDSLRIFDKKNDEISGKRILIFDDIERCKLPTDEIFGYINHFVEHSACKVILVTDEEKIRQKYDLAKDTGISYKDFKEKLVGQTFEVRSDIDDAVDHFIADSSKLNTKVSLSEFKELIIEVFIASRYENLRVLKQTLFDFNRLTTFFADHIKESESYNTFLKNLLFYFIIVVAEYKAGNENIKDFQGIVVLFEDEKESPKIEDKYKHIQAKYQINNSVDVLPISMIIDYIEKGVIDPKALHDQLNMNSFFRKEQLAEWGILWEWVSLESSQFRKLRKSVWSTFYHGRIHQIPESLHIAGIFISLIDNNLSDKSKDIIVKQSKRLIDKLFNTGIDYDLFGIFGIFEHAYGKGYQSKETPEFKEIIRHLSQKIKDQKSIQTSRYLEKIFYGLNDSNTLKLYSLPQEPLPDRHNVYRSIAIFESINGKKIGRILKGLNTTSIYDFKSFLHSRYFPEEEISNVTLEPYHKDDLRCLKELQEEINSNRKKRKIITNHMLDQLDKELTAIIDKLNAIN